MTYNLPNATTPDAQFGQIVSQVPTVPVAMLFFIYGVILLTVHFGQKRSNGVSSFASSACFAGLVSTICALIMFLIGGIISIEIVYLFITFFIIAVLALFFGED